MKLRIILLLALVSVSCAPGKRVEGNMFSEISVWHDDARNVTCYMYKSGYAGGLSCIPDKDLR